MAHQLWFDDVAAMTAAVESAQFKEATEDLLTFVEPRYVHRMAAAEHWVIGPQAR